ncbi:cutinase family protein [Mycolicibacterium neoaurum]|uniref:cutinase family protein n=1 Tax=Mycolicibacterium neoaurum TaxID=1795 RepID=UPI001BD105C8|nr:cutinase family protein [Mycolicibacterium neoaurum]QVI28222.1 cutinase family protein [Mycolicibacterium neoaurum]
MILRLGAAALMAATALAAAPTANAEPACADVHWIGAAGSGQRDGAQLVSNAGMGDVVYASYQQLSNALAAGGRTMTAEAVQYPAAPVPLAGGLGGWMNFMDSVEDGTDATAEQLEAYTARCPQSKVVLAGYSQGAMVVHRNLHDLADNPQVVAALLVADGDRLPADTTINLGSAAAVPGAGKGVAQEHSFLASTDTSPLDPRMGARTVSVCDVGDPVCDYNPDLEEIPASSIAIHTAYEPATSGPHAWGLPLYQLVMNSVSASAPSL